jgi:hypothetical protein
LKASRRSVIRFIQMTTEQYLQDAKLAEAVRRLREAYAPERIYLFGSLARAALEEFGAQDAMLEQLESALDEDVLWSCRGEGCAGRPAKPGVCYGFAHAQRCGERSRAGAW